MKELEDLQKMLGEVKILRPHNGYFYSSRDALLIALCGSFCGLRDLKRIHQWAKSLAAAEFLRDELSILHIPSYSWLTQIFALIDPKSLGEKFTQWVNLTDNLKGKTLAVDGKTVRSTGKMSCFDKACTLSAHLWLSIK